jgi:hypothetical protein
MVATGENIMVSNVDSPAILQVHFPSVLIDVWVAVNSINKIKE